MEKSVAKVSVGVDVSKAYLDVHLFQVNEKFRVKNDTQGHKNIFRRLAKYETSEIICEASGGYENSLVQNSIKAGCKIRVVNARRIREFARATGVRAKTDAVDAKVIAEFGFLIPQSYEQQEMTPELIRLSELHKRKINLKDMIVQEKLRLQNPTYSWTISSIKKHIAFMEKHIQKLGLEIEKLIKTIPSLCKNKEILESFPCVGEETSTALLAGMPELGHINEKQAASLLGVAPFTKESGTYKGVSRIQDGRAAPRKAVYMASLSSTRYNPVLAQFYKKLISKGKPCKVALVAVMRRMIVILNAMLRDQTMWNPKKNIACD